MTSSAEELLRRNEWVRALARRLIAGFDAAEDLAQDTLIAALQRKGAGEARVPERSWLSGVMRHLLHSKLRGEQRRAARERRVARSGVVPGGLESITRAEEQRRVVGAVLELGEPHRSAVLLRYFEDLDHAAIAARLGTSEEAARKRVSRGLQELKKKLARREGGLAALWPLTGWQPVVSGVGVATMSLKPLAWVGALAALALIGWVGRGAFESSQPEVENVPSRIAEDGLRSASGAEGMSSPSARTVREAEEPTLIEHPRGVTESASRGKRVLVRSIDGVSPIPSASLRVGLESEGASASNAVAALLQSDEEGYLELPAELPSAGFSLSHPDHFARHYDQTVLRALPDPGVLELCPIGLLRIRVVDASGAPLMGREVFVEMDSPFGSEAQRWKWRRRTRIGKSDADGRIEATGWPCAVDLIVTAADTWKGGVRAQIDLRTRVAEVVVSPHAGWATLVGTVVQASGAPASHVGLEWFGTSSANGMGSAGATTDAQGRFRIADLSAGAGELQLGALQARGISAELFEGQTTDLGEIQLAPERVIGGRLLSALPLDFQQLRVVLFRDAVQLQELTPSTDGSFTGTVGEGPLLLIVERAGWYDPILPHQARGLTRLELSSPREELEVEVTGPFGVIAFDLPSDAPAPHRIDLYGELDGAFEWGWLAERRTHSELEASAGSPSKILSPPLAPGRYRAVLRTGPEGAGSGAFGEIVELKAQTLETYAFRGVGHGALEVTLLAASTQLATGGTIEIENADRERRSAVIDAAGSARLEALPPGPYLLRATCGDTYATPRLVEIHAEKTTQIEIAAEAKAVLRGRLLGKHGPLPQCALKAQRKGTNRDWVTYTDENGVFAFEPLEPGTYRFWSSKLFVHTVTLRAGETREFDLQSGERGVVVQVERNGKPWIGCSRLSVAACPPGHGVELVWRSALAIGAGRFEVDLPSGPLLFQLDVPGLGNNQTLVVQTPPHAGAGPLVLAPHPTGVRIEASAAFEHMPPPAAYLLELASGPVHSSWGSVFELQRERDGLGRASFPSIPPGSKLRLVGIGAHGEQIEKLVSVDASGVTRVAWP